ncbi:protein in whiE locus [Streptomyces cinnamoneus]|uniref:Protein in whiE locus n=1 Tax=Streptomyces cinnamoneus TaxID=53446 RepID=A0A2G1XAM1_STRCJ|nr:cupin domain-containing protein [Streptomyces cinnamoneus]PHQ48287.1 protein in whiE locus [Streptomyces cinnamoneus]PPT15918.1 cupin domain-containing protein [Streptomyces cinnamoneus]
MLTQHPRIVNLSDTEPNRRRGGDLRAMLTPATVGSTSGFMGLAIIQPGERIGEHYHPYSEEFVYVVSGSLEVDLDGEPHALRPDQGLLIPIEVRHRFRNVGDTEARMVFHLGPLAPHPSLGHVDTEDTGAAGHVSEPAATGPHMTGQAPGQPAGRTGALE